MNPSPSGVEPSEKDSELPLLRERIRILEAERAGQNRTLATAGVATFEWDVAGDAVTGNGLLRLFYGLPDRPGGSPIGALHAAIHPDDRGPRAEALRGALSDGGRYEARYRVAGSDGRERCVLARGDVERGEDGRPSRVSGVVLDVTERVRAEEAIRQREELFRTVFEQAPDDAILVMDVDRTLTGWNPAAERMMGWSAAEAVGQTADVVFTPEDRAEGHPAQEAGRAAATGRSTNERWHLRKDGTRFWGSGTVNSLHGADGSVTGFLKVFRDATERHDEATTLDFLRRLGEAVADEHDPDAIVSTAERMLGEHLGVQRSIYGEFDAQGHAFSVRRDWTNGVGSLAGEHRTADFGSRVAGAVLAGRTDVMRDREQEADLADGLAALRAGECAAAITVPVRKEGRTVGIYAVNSREPRDWSEGEIGLVQQAADRVAAEVERARASAGLRASEERFRAAQETTPDPFTIIEAVRGVAGEVIDFRWTYVNPATESLTGEAEEDQLGALVSERRPGVRGSELWAGWLRTLETGEPFVVERFMDFPVGRQFLRVTCVRVGDGIGSAFLDLTQRQLNVERLEEVVADRTAELRQAVEQAEGFNYSIAHDLRTPLRAIVMTASVLMEELGPELGKEHRELLARQVHNANRLGRLIDELLRLSRFARVEVNRQMLDMTRKARSIFTDMQDQGRANGCRFEAQEGMAASGDPELTRTVLQNLLDNACKFSPYGGTVRMREEGDVFSISDEGVGFDMAHAARMFLPFERLVLDAEFEGTGIGLANVKRIVERHGGRVWAESVPGRGATLFFTLGQTAGRSL